MNKERSFCLNTCLRIFFQHVISMLYPSEKNHRSSGDHLWKKLAGLSWRWTEGVQALWLWLPEVRAVQHALIFIAVLSTIEQPLFQANKSARPVHSITQRRGWIRGSHSIGYSMISFVYHRMVIKMNQRKARTTSYMPELPRVHAERLIGDGTTAFCFNCSLQGTTIHRCRSSATTTGGARASSRQRGRP
jgi:hypothetical protein